MNHSPSLPVSEFFLHRNLSVTLPKNLNGFTSIRTQDGTVIVRDPRTGRTASGRSLAEAEAELRRLLTEREAA